MTDHEPFKALGGPAIDLMNDIMQPDGCVPNEKRAAALRALKSSSDLPTAIGNYDGPDKNGVIPPLVCTAGRLKLANRQLAEKVHADAITALESGLEVRWTLANCGPAWKLDIAMGADALEVTVTPKCGEECREGEHPDDGDGNEEP
jgi:hypothetical protein